MNERMKSTIYDYVQLIKDAFPQKNIEGRTFYIYVGMLEDFDEQLVSYVIKQWILTKKEPPTIAELRENCKLISDWMKITLEE